MTEDPFITHRSLLFTVAYELLGSAADAEDVLQESWLRWAEVDRTQVHDARAYLIQIVTRQSLNRRRTLTRRREDYVGEWLPEPLLTTADVAEDVVLAESVSMAMLTVLETLGPTERAVFVLREVFDLSYEEIARAVGKSTVAVRQTARRARDHVAARRPRVRVSRNEQQAVVDRFLAVLQTGQLEDLMELLAPDVVLIADGGGIVAASRIPIHGAQSVGALLARAHTLLGAVDTVLLNGEPAGRLEIEGAPSTVSLLVQDGRITQIYVVRNPQKLTRLDAPSPLAGATSRGSGATGAGRTRGAPRFRSGSSR
jgi:RNA polymerase sigma-70 factor (ECF subfamily)